MDNLKTLRINEFCARYGLGRTTVHELIRNGELEILKAGRCTLILCESIAAWEAKNTPVTRKESKEKIAVVSIQRSSYDQQRKCFVQVAVIRSEEPLRTKRYLKYV